MFYHKTKQRYSKNEKHQQIESKRFCSFFHNEDADRWEFFSDVKKFSFSRQEVFFLTSGNFLSDVRLY